MLGTCNFKLKKSIKLGQGILVTGYHGCRQFCACQDESLKFTFELFMIRLIEPAVPAHPSWR